MCYKDGRGVVPPAGIRPIQMPRSVDWTIVIL